MTLHRGPLFPTDKDLCSHEPRKDPFKKWGRYYSVKDLLKTHIDLLSEEFIRAVREQLDKIRENPQNWDSLTCYEVMVKGVQGADVEVSFDASKYEWEEGRRFLFHNLVFLSRNGMKDFVIGLVTNSDKEELKKGRAVVKLIRGVKSEGGKSFIGCDATPYLNQSFTLVESRAFYFPFLHVTNALRRDLEITNRLDEFEDEIVNGRGWSPFKRAQYLNLFHKKDHRDGADLNKLNTKFQSILQTLTSSQREALSSVLGHKVALVQGPPGTGKTFLGCKIAEYLLELKRVKSQLLPGPILVVTTTNHTVREFLTRCLSFTDKVIHGYSDKHEKENYGSLQEEYNKEMCFDERRQLMHRAHILSMTTTRAAYIRPTLDKLQIKIVIVEEAARELEGFVLASIPRGAEHLILLGDHKQLRPVCTSREFGRTYGLELSLFERLINNGAHCPMLNDQRRMRPEIADLVRDIYPTLTDHTSTLNRPQIDGINLKVPVFFLKHEEREVQDGSGYYNPWEAKMVAHLCRYLLVQGVCPSEITVLAAYRKQIACITNEIKKIRGTSFGLRVCTVDGFQGEENTIIILSLVRSNSEALIGFMKMENRVCVALSRAKDGFFLVGDVNCLTGSGSPIWNRVHNLVKTGAALPLKCVHGKMMDVKTPESFEAALCCVCKVHAEVEKAQAFHDWAHDLLKKTDESLRKLEERLNGELEAKERERLERDFDLMKTRRVGLNDSANRWSSKKREAEEASKIVDEWFNIGLISAADTSETLQARIIQWRQQEQMHVPSRISGLLDALMGHWQPVWDSLNFHIKKYFETP